MNYLRIGVYLSLILALSACKATTLGGAVEKAIAPISVNNPESNPNNKILTLPKDFSSDIPIYPKAVLQTIEQVANNQNTFTRWTTTDPIAQVSSFYEDAFTKQQWRVILRSPDGNFVMQKANQLLTLSIQSIPVNPTPINATSPVPTTSTSIFLQYLRDPKISQDLNIAVNPAISPEPAIPNQVISFSDIDTVSEALRSLVIDLQKLGTITAKQDNQFKPNDLIQRREYVRWLLNTNNRLYANRPTRQIRLADANSTPTFVDIPPSDPDFAVIQAMVNAGLIPTDPSQVATSKRFRPNEPINRETLLQWKIPLDLRSAIPSANIEAVKQAWGFQDSDRISPTMLKFVLADFKLGDLSNIRRSFGYTTLFQPKKYVTRAEAAAVLWYFGTPEDGLSAQNALEQISVPSPNVSEPNPVPKQPDPTDKLPESTPPKSTIN